MAFGDFLGGLTVNAASITNPTVAVGSVVVSVGDLVLALVAEENAITATAVTDNLGNTYSAINAGTGFGTLRVRGFYSRVSVAGTLTAVSAACTASSNDVVFDANVYAGPFLGTPLDVVSFTNLDNTSPIDSSATGTLSQADELVIAYAVRTGNASAPWSATAPMALDSEHFSSTVIALDVGHYVVSSTSTTTPQFTTGTNPTVAAEVTVTFKKGTLNASLSANGGSYSLTGAAATLRQAWKIAGAAGSYALTGSPATPFKTSSIVTSTQVLQKPVDYFMDSLPQYSATGRTYEPSYGKAGTKTTVKAGKRGRLAGPAPSFKTTTNRRGYD